MGKHLAPLELDLINRLSRKNGADFVSRALAAVNKARRRQGQDALTRSPIYRYTKGMTHKRAAKEKRGVCRSRPTGRCSIPCLGPWGPMRPGPGAGPGPQAWVHASGPARGARAVDTVARSAGSTRFCL